MANRNSDEQRAAKAATAEIRARDAELARKQYQAEAAAVLARAPQLAGLTELRLGHCSLEDQGAALLAEYAHLQRLTRLSLLGNTMGGPGVTALAA